MKLPHKTYLAYGLIVFLFTLTCGCKTTAPPHTADATASTTTSSTQNCEPGWIHCEGTDLIQSDGSPFLIQAIALGTEDVSMALSLPLDSMYDDIVSLGFNTVTLHVRYDLLQTSSLNSTFLEEGFSCLDAHIEHAAQRGLYTIIHMDTPPGGFQSWGQGGELWADPNKQDQLSALWGAIADRYADQPTVLGYSLLNEPCPLAQSGEGALASWQSLSEKLIESIRSQDSRHLLFVDELYRYVDESGKMVNPQNRTLSNGGFPILDDPGVVLQSNQYFPYTFTSQPESRPQDTPYLIYPSEFAIGLKQEDDKLLYSLENDVLDTTSQDWQVLTSELMLIDDPRVQYVQPCISLWQMGVSGMVWIDEVCLDEFDEHGQFMRTALQLSFDSQTDFAHYANTGNTVYQPPQENQTGYLYISGVQEGGYAIAEAARLPVHQGHSYQLRITVKGAHLPDSSTISPMLCFTSGSGLLKMNQDSLAWDLAYRIDASQARNQPLYIGAFGSNLESFSHGATAWIEDLISLYRQNGIGFGYFLYRNDYYGLYRFDGTCNQSLYSLFQQLLA